MNRLLVAPWHGLLKEGQVYLPNGETRSVNQPNNNHRGTTGPGDTHRITVPNIAPLTPEEVAATPAGGYYRTGQALISGDRLYGVTGLSWIYQDLTGSKWAVLIDSPVVSSTTTTLQLHFSRFGEFAKPPENYVRGITIPKGQPSGADLNRICAPDGFNTGVVRLHAVSDSGRTVILTLSAYNAPTSEATERTTDARHRHYVFIKFSLRGTGPLVFADMEILYSGAAIYSNTELEFTGGAFHRPDVQGPSVEVGRVPRVNEAGEHYADRVSYDWAQSVPMAPGTNPGENLRTSSTYATEEKWLVRVVFEGEQPVPCYLKNLYAYETHEMTFSLQTLAPFIRDEYLSGAMVTIQAGAAIMTGGGSSSGSSTISWQGPGDPWSRIIPFSNSAYFDGSSTHLVGSSDGVGEESVANFLTDMGFYAYSIAPSNLANFLGMPCVGNWLFCFYSNNLLAVIRANADGTARFNSVLTPTGSIDHDESYPVEDQRHFGSFNPITGEFVVGSAEIVNWA